MAGGTGGMGMNGTSNAPQNGQIMNMRNTPPPGGPAAQPQAQSNAPANWMETQGQPQGGYQNQETLMAEMRRTIQLLQEFARTGKLEGASGGMIGEKETLRSSSFPPMGKANTAGLAASYSGSGNTIGY